jgi:hypothetical protein
MNNIRKPRGYWTKERCQEEALKYNNRKDFNIYSKSAYLRSIKNRWIDEICSHMIVSGNKYKRCIYSYEFDDNFVYVGLTFNINKRQINRDYDITDKVTKHIKETSLQPLRKQLTDYIDVNDAIKMEEYFINFYKNNGWFILNKNKAGGIGCKISPKWDFNKVKEEALKYKTRTEFKNNSSGAYYTAINNNWLNDVCSHMIYKTKLMNYWKNIDRCKEEALKYNKISEFQKKSRGAYVFAKKNGWLDEICSHMIKKTKPAYYWTFDKCKEVALECETKKDFIKLYSGAYDAILRNKWLYEIFPKK